MSYKQIRTCHSCVREYTCHFGRSRRFLSGEKSQFLNDGFRFEISHPLRGFDITKNELFVITNKALVISTEGRNLKETLEKSQKNPQRTIFHVQL